MKTIRHTADSLHATEFAQRVGGWHTYGKNKRTQRAIERAKELGRIETNEFRQFRAVQPVPAESEAA